MKADFIRLGMQWGRRLIWPVRLSSVMAILSGIATGLHTLDARMGGLQSSDLIVLAGRPAMGKTALATNIAFNIAEAYEPEVQPDGSHKAANGGVVGFFSLEMSSEQLGHANNRRADRNFFE